MKINKNDKEDDQVKRIQKSIDRFEWMLTQRGWVINSYYCDCFDDMPDGTGSKNTVAVTSPDFEYLTTDIHFNLKKVSVISDDELDYSVIHEFTHALVSPIHYDLEENAVTTISRLLHWYEKERTK